MLAAWNRAGFLTDGSQPGDLEECAVQGTLGRQRAAVEGYIDRLASWVNPGVRYR